MSSNANLKDVKETEPSESASKPTHSNSGMQTKPSEPKVMSTTSRSTQEIPASVVTQKAESEPVMSNIITRSKARLLQAHSEIILSNSVSSVSKSTKTSSHNHSRSSRTGSSCRSQLNASARQAILIEKIKTQMEMDQLERLQVQKRLSFEEEEEMRQRRICEEEEKRKRLILDEEMRQKRIRQEEEMRQRRIREEEEILYRQQRNALELKAKLNEIKAEIKYQAADASQAEQVDINQSNNEKYSVGTVMVVGSGWRNGGKSNGDDVWYLRHDVPEEVSQSAGCGILGMVGISAYYGLKYICKPKPGQTLMISGASGGVGTVVGQLGKIMGCKVIGSCGSDEKVAFVKSAGFDDAFNYKKESVDDALRRLAPEGVDCYFDNVGGDFSSAVIRHINMYGRIACCGAISTYNAKEPVKADVIQTDIIGKMLLMQGFNILYLQDKCEEIYEVLRDWAKQGKLKAYEAITEGFENVPSTFIKMFQGKYLGKVIIKV